MTRVRISSRLRWPAFALAIGALALASCVQLIPPGKRATVSSSPPTTAALAGIRPGPAIASLGMRPGNATAALASFTESCPRLLQRTDASGLTRQTDWSPACTAARGWPANDAPAFFERYFEAAQVGDASAFVTGYYEPEIAGVRNRQPGYDVPVYAMPPDLVRARPGDATAGASGKQPLGRYDEAGRFVLYHDRAEIEAGALAGRGLEIAWVADPIEFFFLQIQGSGRLRAPDGSVMRIGYAGQNGREYVGIGSAMRQRGLIGTGPGQYPGSMQGIVQYLRDNPTEGAALMRENKSWIFFSELRGDGPLGALNVPVRGRASVAADPAFVPLGAPVVLQVDRPEASGLWIAQDTGGAIKGANRFDSFWGAGEEAARIAGGMSARGSAVLLLPKGTVARLRGR